MKDKLDNFIELLALKDTQHTKGVRSFLDQLYGYSEAFLYFYDNLPEKIKPPMDKDLAEKFFYVLKNYDVDTFNRYFDLFKEHIEPNRIREYSINKPENLKLQEYIKNEGKPKNIGQVLTMLKGLYEKNDSRFFNELQKYKQEIIDKLKKNKNPASSSVAIVVEWFSKVHNNAGWNAVDKLSEELGINLFEFCEKFKKSIGFGNYLFHSTNWYEFETILNRYEKNVPAYKIFRTVTGFTDCVTTLAQTVQEKPELVPYLWKKYYRPYMEDFIENQRCDPAKKMLTETLDKEHRMPHKLFYLAFKSSVNGEFGSGWQLSTLSSEVKEELMKALYYAELNFDILTVKDNKPVKKMKL